MIVLVHGVPETAAIWNKVRNHLDGDSVALAMPGFAGPRPEGFGATKDEYVAWLLGELDHIGEPVDLVGHDWGSGLTYRVATAYGDRIRSWSADVANVMHPNYVWHDFARIWQTSGDGEAFFHAREGEPAEDRAALFEALGVAHDDAVAMASWASETMASCILDLYRSAVPNPYADWNEAWGPTLAPGLVLWPSEDPFGDEVQSIEVAEVLGAHHQALDGVGHWWPLQAPATTAAVLNKFISSIE